MVAKFDIPDSVCVARADTPIFDCVQLMKSKNIGSILLVSDDENEKLVGIFTERDLLKNFDIITQKENWKKPIRTVMTKKLITISPEEIENCEELMVRHNLRHLPVVVNNKSGQQFFGIISMRDIFKKLIQVKVDWKISSVFNSKNRGTTAFAELEPIRIGFFTRELAFQNFIEKLLASAKLVSVEKMESKWFIAPTKFPEEIKKHHLLLLDLDFLEVEDCKRILGFLAEEKKSIKVLLTYSQNMFEVETKIKKLVEKVASQSVAIMPKPLPVMQFLDWVEKAIQKNISL